MSWIILIFSLVAMALGADWLVRGCSRLAARIGVSEFLVSVIIIGIGTTLPEIIVSLLSTGHGMGTLVVSNCIGSNTLRILGVFGMGLLLQPMVTNGQKRKIDIYFAFLAAIALMWTIADGAVTAFDGAVLLGIFAAYCAAHWINSVQHPKKIKTKNIRPSKIVFPLFASIVALYLGSQYFMEALTVITADLNLDERMAALLIVAPGTSAPEILITIIAAARKRAGIILGNILGANLANIALAVGISAFIIPLPVSSKILKLDIWVMVAATAVFCGLLLQFKRLPRWIGAVFLAALGLYYFFI